MHVAMRFKPVMPMYYLTAYLHGFYEEEQRRTRPGEVTVNVSLPVQLLRCLRRFFK